MTFVTHAKSREDMTIQFQICSYNYDKRKNRRFRFVIRILELNSLGFIEARCLFNSPPFKILAKKKRKITKEQKIKNNEAQKKYMRKRRHKQKEKEKKRKRMLSETTTPVEFEPKGKKRKIIHSPECLQQQQKDEYVFTFDSFESFNSLVY